MGGAIPSDTLQAVEARNSTHFASHDLGLGSEHGMSLQDDGRIPVESEALGDVDRLVYIECTSSDKTIRTQCLALEEEQHSTIFSLASSSNLGLVRSVRSMTSGEPTNRMRIMEA